MNFKPRAIWELLHIAHCGLLLDEGVLGHYKRPQLEFLSRCTLILQFAGGFFLPAESTESRGKFDFLHNYKSAVILSHFRAVFITSESHEEAGQGKHSTRITVLAEDD